jgi:hypothetical protein
VQLIDLMCSVCLSVCFVKPCFLVNCCALSLLFGGFFVCGVGVFFQCMYEHVMFRRKKVVRIVGDQSVLYLF